MFKKPSFLLSPTFCSFNMSKRNYECLQVFFSPGLAYFSPGLVYFSLGLVYFGPGLAYFSPGLVYT